MDQTTQMQSEVLMTDEISELITNAESLFWTKDDKNRFTSRFLIQFFS